MTHWLGGIGIVVLFVAVAPLLGVGAARLIGAEMSGLTQPRLTPRITDTAKALVIIYLAISVSETVALLLARMPLYDAVVNTFGTVATGGFSHKTASVGYYDSLAIEAIIGFFMVASGISFSLYYLLYTRRRLDVLLDRELLAYLGIIAAAALFIWGILVLEGDYGVSWGTALRTRRSPSPASSPPQDSSRLTSTSGMRPPRSHSSCSCSSGDAPVPRRAVSR